MGISVLFFRRRPGRNSAQTADSQPDYQKFI
jgi:hypothetical protein